MRLVGIGFVMGGLYGLLAEFGTWALVLGVALWAVGFVDGRTGA